MAYSIAALVRGGRVRRRRRAVAHRHRAGGFLRNERPALAGVATAERTPRHLLAPPARTSCGTNSRHSPAGRRGADLRNEPGTRWHRLRTDSTERTPGTRRHTPRTETAE